MVDRIEILDEIVLLGQHLLPNETDRATLPAISGQVRVVAAGAPALQAANTDNGPGGGPLPDPTPFVKIELFRPGAASPAATDTLDGPPEQGERILLFDIPEGEEGDWQVVVTNVSQRNLILRRSAQFVRHRVDLATTAIPHALLTRFVETFLNALELQINLDRQNSFVDFSPQLKSFSNGALRRLSLADADDIDSIEGYSLGRYAFRASQAENGNAQLEATVVFVARDGAALHGDCGVDVEADNIVVVVTFELTTVGDRPLQDGRVLRKRQVLPLIKTQVKVAGDFDPLGDLFVEVFTLLGGSQERQAEGKLRGSIRGKLKKEQITIGEYLTEALIQLAQRGDELYAIRSDSESFLVDHFKRPPFRPLELPDAPPPGRLDPVDPPGLDDFHAGPPPTHDVVAPSGTPGSSSSAVAPPGTAAELGGSPSDTLARPGARATASLSPEAQVLHDKIDHIVVLMMENRSFDHMLGYLRAEGVRNDIEGLTGNETNPLPSSSNLDPLKVERMDRLPIAEPITRFPFSPKHEFGAVQEQINDGRMSGFVENFRAHFPSANPQWIMGYYAAEQLPTYDFLARNYLVCNRWFSSHPGPTWPNRFCTLSGKTPVLHNFSLDDPRVGYLRLSTIFDVLKPQGTAGIEWKYYEHDISMLRVYDKYRLDNDRIVPFKVTASSAEGDIEVGFAADARNGRLPPVSFIDPNFIDLPPERDANDDHAPADILRGQALVCEVYNALKDSPSWDRTLFVITYDEHGGFYDHYPPPGTGEFTTRFPNDAFEIQPVHFPAGDVGASEPAPSYGVRVPTIVVSPWVAAGVVSNTIFDHASIAKTILLRFVPGLLNVLGPRVEHAADLGSLLTEDARSDRPSCPPVPPPQGTRGSIAPAAGSVGAVGSDPVDFHLALSLFPLPLPVPPT